MTQYGGGKKRISKFENWAKNIRQTKMGKKRDRKNERDASGVFLNGFHGWPKMRPLSRVFSFFFYQCVCVLMCVCVCFFWFFFLNFFVLAGESRGKGGQLMLWGILFQWSSVCSKLWRPRPPNLPHHHPLPSSRLLLLSLTNPVFSPYLRPPLWIPSFSLA